MGVFSPSLQNRLYFFAFFWRAKASECVRHARRRVRRVSRALRPLRASLAQKRQKIAPVLQAVFHHEIQTSKEGDFPLQWSPVEKNSRKLILILLSYELGSIFFAVQSFRFLGMGTYIGVPFRFTQDSMLTPILLPLENLRFFRCVGFWL